MIAKSLVLLGVFLLSIPTVRAVDSAEGGPRTYKIDSSTQIQIDDADATADQLKTGLHAEVVEDTLQPGSARSIEAHSISAQGGKPTKPAAAPAKGAKAPATPAAPPAAAKHWTITAVSATSITITYK